MKRRRKRRRRDEFLVAEVPWLVTVRVLSGGPCCSLDSETRLQNELGPLVGFFLGNGRLASWLIGRHFLQHIGLS